MFSLLLLLCVALLVLSAFGQQQNGMGYDTRLTRGYYDAMYEEWNETARSILISAPTTHITSSSTNTAH